MEYKYQHNFLKTYENSLKRLYSKENRIAKAKKIVKILERHIRERQLEPLKKRKVLDIGCSVGHITAYLASYVDEIIGTEFPKRISNFYIRVMGRGTEYFENLLSYRDLRKLVKPFRLYDYTIDVIRHPNEYEAEDMKSNRIISATLGLPFIRYILTGYLWILEK